MSELYQSDMRLSGSVHDLVRTMDSSPTRQVSVLCMAIARVLEQTWPGTSGYLNRMQVADGISELVGIIVETEETRRQADEMVIPDGG